MAFNFLRDPSIPVREGIGPPQYIPPWQVSACGPGWELAAPRPDLGGALIQMLIGLLQTGCPPADEKQWADWYRQPPPPQELRQRLAPLEPFFNLDHGQRRFMQDMDCPTTRAAVPLAYLLPDQPADNTLECNKDLFVKQGVIDAMCPPCLAAALYWRQSSMGGFGRGYRYCLRYKNPLTTVVLGQGLWQTLWLNVLARNEFEKWSHWSGRAQPSARFPWMGTVARSDKNQTILPDQVHPDQVYWPMAQSLVVDTEQFDQAATCPVCGRPDQKLYRVFYRRNHGPLYHNSGWRHPLSATRPNRENLAEFVQTPKGGICYRDWLGLITGSVQDDGVTKPPPVVEAYFRRSDPAAIEPVITRDFRAWAFGLEMKQAKSLLFTDSLMPLVALDSEQRWEFDQAVAALVEVARESAKRLGWSLKEALCGPKAKAKVTQGALAQAQAAFWSDTEAAFREALGRLQQVVQSGELDGPEARAIKEEWLATLAKTARRIFEQLADYPNQDKPDPKRQAQASVKLRSDVGPWTKKLRDMLGLPQVSKTLAGGEA